MKQEKVGDTGSLQAYQGVRGRNAEKSDAVDDKTQPGSFVANASTHQGDLKGNKGKFQ